MSEMAFSRPKPFPKTAPTFGKVRDEHGRLLRRQRTERSISAFRGEVEEFVEMACRSGAYLQLDEYRDATQALIDYWTATLYREHARIRETALVEFDPTLAPPVGDCPYRGLEPFRESDAPLFFGREAIVEQMKEMVERRFLAVIGPSGSGKSSAVRAGLIPALKDDKRYASYLTLLPGSHPLAALAQLLTPPPTIAEADAEQWRAAQIPLFHANAAHLRTMLSPAAGGPMFLYVDQFEELFTMTVDAAEQRAFIANLLALAGAADAPHAVVISVRSDYETRLAIVKELQDRVANNQVRIPPMTRPELRLAIESPAEAAGLEIEAALTDRLIDDIVGNPAALPLLQLTLYKVWQERHRNLLMYRSYEKLGGATRALERTADKAYENLLEQDKTAARLILLRMVRARTGEEPTSHRVRRSDLHRIPMAPEGIDLVLDQLTRNGLLRRTHGHNEADDQFEVAHEALVRNWPTLVRWIDEERVKLATLHRIEGLAEEWIIHDRTAGFLDAKQLLEAERWLEESGTTLGSSLAVAEFIEASRDRLNRHRRNERLLWITLGVVLLGFVAGGFVLNRQKEKLERAAERAQAQAEQTRVQIELQKREAMVQQARREAAEKDYAAVKNARTQSEFVEGLETRYAVSQLQLISALDANASLRAQIAHLQGRLTESETQKNEAMTAAKTDEESTASLLVALRREREMRREKEKELEELRAAHSAAQGPPRIKETLKPDALGLRRKTRPGLMAGASVSGPEVLQAGSLCCAVRDKRDRRFILGLASVLGSTVGGQVVQPGAADGGTTDDTIGMVWKTAKGLSIAQLVPGLTGGSSAVPHLGPFDDTEDTVPIGQNVRAVGRASGLMRGKVLAIEKDGTIVTDLAALPGDYGAPVVNPGEELIGLIWSSTETRTIIRPIDPILRELGVELIR